MKRILTNLFIISCLFFASISHSNELESLHEYAESVQKEIEQMKASGNNASSTISRNMFIYQLENLITESSNKIVNFANSDLSEQEKTGVIALLERQEITLSQQQNEAAQILKNLFVNFESASIEDQPIQWMTVSGAIDYQSQLLLLEKENLKTQEAHGKNVTNNMKTFNRQVQRVASELYIVLKASLKQTTVLQAERSLTPSDQRGPIDSRVRMQQRMNRTFSANLKVLVPLIESAGLDTTKYNELAFNATGELSDAIVSSDAFFAVGHSFYIKFSQWITENASVAASKTIIFFLILFLFRYLSGLVKKIIEKVVRAPQSKLSTLIQDFIVSMSGKTVMLLGVLIALAQVGLNLGPLLTGLGVAGIVIGFALQDTLSNFASGMMILIYRPFDVEDIIEAGGVSGAVNHMSLVNTTIRTFDNQIFIVPNRKIWGDTIKNITAEKVRRVDMVFGIGYGDDIEKTERVLQDIVDSNSKILRSPATNIKVMTLNDSSVDFIVRPWVKTADYWDVYWGVTREVKLRFDKEGISIPFPQRDVHLYQEK